MEQRNDELEIDLMEIFYVLKSKLFVIILSAVIFAIGAGLFTNYFITPMYASTSSIYVLTNESVISYADLQIGASLTSDYVEMVKSHNVIDTVIEKLGMEDELDYKRLCDCISVQNKSDTRILDITVVYDDPRVAKEIVDVLSEVAADKISEIMDTKKPNIYDKGIVSVDPVSPSMKKNVVVAGMFGMLLAMAVIVVLYLLDDTIHSSEDIEKYLKINTLAAIPLSEGSEVEVKRDDRKRRKGDGRLIRIGKKKK